MTDPATWTSLDRMAAMRSGLARFGDVQRVIVESARSTFRGRLTYAAGTWEDVEWDAFDIVSIDAYRDAGNEAGYRDQIRTSGTGSRHGVVWRRRHRGAIRASGRHHLGTLGGLPCHLGRLRAPSQPRSPVRQGATREDPSLAGGSVMTPLAYPC